MNSNATCSFAGGLTGMIRGFFLSEQPQAFEFIPIRSIWHLQLSQALQSESVLVEVHYEGRTISMLATAMNPRFITFEYVTLIHIGRVVRSSC